MALGLGDGLGRPPTAASTNDKCDDIGAANWASTVAVKVYLLARNTEATAVGYTNQKSYALGLNADGSINTVAAYNDRFRRHVYQASVRVYNSSGRNQ